jgi:hypothetical protein
MQDTTLLPWQRYIVMLAAGLFLFMTSAILLIEFTLENRYDSKARDAYDYHILLQAQQAMDRLNHRLELAQYNPASVQASETRASLQDEIGMAWSRFHDLISGENAKRLRLIPGLESYVVGIKGSLAALEDALKDGQADYAAYYQALSEKNLIFSRNFTSLPAHLLPVQQDRQNAGRRQQMLYYLAVIFSSLIVLLMYGLALRQTFGAGKSS